jgi:hypothetical protein
MFSGSCGPTVFMRNQRLEQNRRKPGAKRDRFARRNRQPRTQPGGPERKRRSPEGGSSHPQRRNQQGRRRKAKTTATAITDILKPTQNQKTVFKNKRYKAIGTGDTELYVFAGMLAAVVISIRVFLFRGAGKAN